jgi:redox-sensitive bicupin YhaK (pirin superfamily)
VGQVPPHPHIGLQTASWLFDGAVLHRDSLGTEQLIRPGELNLMTSGRGIAHSEESPAVCPGLLHGVQLWIALPAAYQFTEPDFAHHAAARSRCLPVRASSTGCSPRTAPRVSAARRSPAPPRASSRECSRIFR